MAHPSFRDLADYIGGAGVSGNLLVFDAGGRVTQATPSAAATGVHSLTGLRVGTLFSTTANSLAFFGLTPVAQQAKLATLSTALTSVDAADSTIIALALNSLGLTMNSVNLYLHRFGLQASA